MDLNQFLTDNNIGSADKGATLSQTVKYVQSSYGDGYSQTVAVGINNRKRNYRLSFTKRPYNKIRLLVDWLLERENVSMIEYTHYNDIKRTYYVRTVQFTDSSPNPCTVSFSLEETFNLG